MTLRTSQNHIVTGRLRSVAIDETTICYELGFALIISQISVFIRKLIERSALTNLGGSSPPPMRRGTTRDAACLRYGACCCNRWRARITRFVQDGLMRAFKNRQRYYRRAHYLTPKRKLCPPGSLNQGGDTCQIGRARHGHKISLELKNRKFSLLSYF